MPIPKKRYLDEMDLGILEEGFEAGYSPVERRQAEEVLRALGFEKKVKAQKRPGPKKSTQLNKTEESLRRLVATVRAVLNLPDALPKMETLAVLDWVLATSDSLLRDHFFVTIRERQQLRALSERATRSEYEIVRALPPLLQPGLDALGKPSAKWDLMLRDLASDGVSALRNRISRKPKNNRKPRSEEKIYSDIASTLQLDTRAWIRRDAKRTDRRKGAPAFGSVPLKEMKLSRGSVLVTAIGRLFHLESVFSTSQLVLPGDACEAISVFLEENEPEVLRGPEKIQLILRELSTLFWNIRNRQGVSPRRLKLEDIDLDRSPSSEGQISTGR